MAQMRIRHPQLYQKVSKNILMNSKSVSQKLEVEDEEIKKNTGVSFYSQNNQVGIGNKISSKARLHEEQEELVQKCLSLEKMFEELSRMTEN